MKLKSLLFPLAALLIGSAASPPPVVFEATEKKGAVTIEFGQELTVVLPTSDPDHVWQIAGNDIRYLKETTKIIARPGGPTAGATISFQTRRGGHTRLSFVYVKPTDTGEITPADTRDIAVTITKR